MTPDGTHTREQFSGLIERHETLIQNMCVHRASGDRHRCAELRQECYISIWKHQNSLRPDSNPLQESLWVYWQCRSAFSRMRFLDRTHLLVPLDDEMADTLAASDERVMSDCLESLAAVLTPHELRLVELIVEGYTADEMADKLGIKSRSAIQLRYRVMTKLRHHFNNDKQ